MRKLSLFLFLSLVFFAPAATFAGGFQVNLQGIKQAGMGHCGAGLVLDASSVFFNPGSMSMLENSSFSIGSTPIFGRIAYQEAAPGTYSAENVPGISTPFSAYYAHRFSGKLEKLSAGIGVYTPFGSSLSWDDNWKYASLIRKISLLTVFTQPTVSYKLNDHFGFGVGMVIGYGDVTLAKAVPLQQQNGDFGHAELSGSAIGFGANAGIYFTPNEKFSLGLTYRTSVKYVAEGDATFDVPVDLQDSFPTTTFSSEIVLPQNLTLGFGYKPIPKLQLAADLQWVGWTSYDTLAFIFADTTQLLQNQYNARNFTNSFVIRLGGQYEAAPNLDLRTGIAYDMTPIPDDRITPETPDANKLAVSVGASYDIVPALTVDATFMWVEAIERSGYNPLTDFGGSYQARAFIPGVGLTWNIGKKKSTGEIEEVLLSE